jgi:hypothetical protein
VCTSTLGDLFNIIASALYSTLSRAGLDLFYINLKQLSLPLQLLPSLINQDRSLENPWESSTMIRIQKANDKSPIYQFLWPHQDLNRDP